MKNNSTLIGPLFFSTFSSVIFYAKEHPPRMFVNIRFPSGSPCPTDRIPEQTIINKAQQVSIQYQTACASIDYKASFILLVDLYHYTYKSV